MTSPDLSGLIERVEAAGEGSRELDRAIAVARGWVQENLYRDADYRPGDWHHPASHAPVRDVPAFTRSLDAAMTLVPRGWIVEIRRYFNSDGEYVAAVDLTDSGTVGRGCHPEEELTVQSRIVERKQGDDPTPRALVAASLRAQKEQANG